MKKLFVLFGVAVVMIVFLSLVSCSNSSTEPEDDPVVDDIEYTIFKQFVILTNGTATMKEEVNAPCKADITFKKYTQFSGEYEFSNDDNPPNMTWDRKIITNDDIIFNGAFDTVFVKVETRYVRI